MTNNVPSSYPGYGSTDYSKLGGSPGESYLGLSEVVKAQWDKECVNLSLYKRDLVYDQDFNVKNILTVEPQSSSQYNTASSFADPVITSSTFTVEPNVSSTMTAGEHIVLKSGFKAKSGSHFIARIEPNNGTDGNRYSGNANTNTSANTNSPADNKLPRASFIVTPNPSNGQFTVSTSAEGSNRLFVYDMVGKMIFENAAFTGITTFDLSGYPKGVYFIQIITTTGQSETQKILIQ